MKIILLQNYGNGIYFTRIRNETNYQFVIIPDCAMGLIQNSSPNYIGLNLQESEQKIAAITAQGISLF